MPFTLVAYDLLKSSIVESINSLMKHHKLDVNKPEESLFKLPAERRVQSQFLLNTITLLDPLDKQPEDQARILNAAAYYVRSTISDIYKNSYAVKSPERSNFYNSLTTSLDLNKGNEPGLNDLVDMYGSLEKFIRSNVYKSSDPRKNYLKAQPYSIEGYSVEDDIIALSSQVHKWRVEIIVKAKEQHQKELADKKPAPPSRGFLGLFGASAAAAHATSKKGRGHEATEKKESRQEDTATI